MQGQRRIVSPFHVRKRLEYMAAIREAIHGLETARVTLAKMVRGMEGEGGAKE